MSYVRFSGPDGPQSYVSDVYILQSVACPEEERYECCNCQLGDVRFPCFNLEGIVAHVEAHVAAGHQVPDFVIPRLRGEAGAR